MHNHLALLLVAEAILFVFTMVLATRESKALAGEYIGIGFHLLLLPVIVSIAAPGVGIASGFLWIVCDVVASTGLIWNHDRPSEQAHAVFNPIRMAGHIFAALWIVAVSLQLGTVGMIVGSLLALGFAAYSLAGGRIPEKALALPGVLLLVWLLLVAWKSHHGTLGVLGG